MSCCRGVKNNVWCVTLVCAVEIIVCLLKASFRDRIMKVLALATSCHLGVAEMGGEDVTCDRWIIKFMLPSIFWYCVISVYKCHLCIQ